MFGSDGQLTVEDVEVRGALFDSDWEILSLEVETPEESVRVIAEHIVIGLRERAEKAEQEVEQTKEDVERVRKHHEEDVAVAAKRIEGLEQELEQVRLERYRAEVTLSQVREEVERLFNEVEGNAALIGLSRLQAILDSSPSLSGGGESSGVGQGGNKVELLECGCYAEDGMVTDEGVCTGCGTQVIRPVPGTTNTSLSGGTETVALSPLDRETISDLCDWLDSKGPGAGQDAAWLRRKLLSSDQDMRRP